MSSMFLTAQSAWQHFDKGQKEYKRGAIEAALSEFQAMPEKGPGAWFNIGACYEALDNFPQAIICYQRAQCNASHALYAKSSTAQNELCAQLALSCNPRSWFEVIAQRCSPLFLQILFLFCWYCMWVIVVYYRDKKWLYGVQALLFLLIVLVGSVLFVHYKDDQHAMGMTIKNVPMLAGPHAHYDVMQQVPRLQKVYIKDARPNWYKVSTQKSVGWIPSEMIELV